MLKTKPTEQHPIVSFLDAITLQLEMALLQRKTQYTFPFVVKEKTKPEQSLDSEE